MPLVGEPASGVGPSPVPGLGSRLTAGSAARAFCGPQALDHAAEARTHVHSGKICVSCQKTEEIGAMDSPRPLPESDKIYYTT